MHLYFCCYMLFTWLFCCYFVWCLHNYFAVALIKFIPKNRRINNGWISFVKFMKILNEGNSNSRHSACPMFPPMLWNRQMKCTCITIEHLVNEAETSWQKVKGLFWQSFVHLYLCRMFCKMWLFCLLLWTRNLIRCWIYDKIHQLIQMRNEHLWCIWCSAMETVIYEM